MNDRNISCTALYAAVAAVSLVTATFAYSQSPTPVTPPETKSIAPTRNDASNQVAVNDSLRPTDSRYGWDSSDYRGYYADDIWKDDAYRQANNTPNVWKGERRQSALDNTRYPLPRRWEAERTAYVAPAPVYTPAPRQEVVVAPAPIYTPIPQQQQQITPPADVYPNRVVITTLPPDYVASQPNSTAMTPPIEDRAVIASERQAPIVDDSSRLNDANPTYRTERGYYSDEIWKDDVYRQTNNTPNVWKGERRQNALDNTRYPLPRTWSEPRSEIVAPVMTPAVAAVPVYVPQQTASDMSSRDSVAVSNAPVDNAPVIPAPRAAVADPVNAGVNGQSQAAPAVITPTPMAQSDVNKSLTTETEKPLATAIPAAATIPPIVNDAQLDLPGIRKSMTDFVDSTVAEGGPAQLGDSFVRTDRERLAVGSDDELNKSIADFRATWKAKYNSGIHAQPNAMVMSNEIRIVSPDSLNEARLAGDRTGPQTYDRSSALAAGDQVAQRTDLEKTNATGTRQDSSGPVNRDQTATGNQINDRDAANKDRPNEPTDANRKDVVDQNTAASRTEARAKSELLAGPNEAVVLIPVTKICTDSSMKSDADKLSADAAKGAAKAMDVAGDQINKLGENGNRVGDSITSGAQKLDDKSKELDAKTDTQEGGKFAKVADRQLHMVREDNMWRIDLPDSKDAATFRHELSENLKALIARQAEWPADQETAYQMLTAHVLGAAAQ